MTRSGPAGFHDGRGIQLRRGQDGALLLTLPTGELFSAVRIVRAAPLSWPNRYISILDSLGEEICMLHDLSGLNGETARVIDEELRSRYLTSTIKKVVSIRREMGTLYCKVDTDRGRRDLLLQQTDESVRWFGERRVVLTDIDGNRFELPDIHKLDRRSARLLLDNLGV
jgi:hypothetical protein